MKSAEKVLFCGLAALLALGTVNQAQAYYDRYPDGYWDRDGRYQHYEIHHHHRGYWDQRGGSRVFINIG